MHRRIHILLTGGAGVGKSALISQYIYSVFPCEYHPTIEDYYQKQISVDNEICFVGITDTGGGEYFSQMKKQWFQNADGFMCIFALDDCDSFMQTKSDIRQIKRARSDAVVVLVGNKADCSHKVTEGWNVAATNGFSFVETSAKTTQGVQYAFDTLLREIKKKKNNTRDKIKNKKKCRCSIL